MKLFTWLKSFTGQKVTKLSTNAMLYPDKIIIITFDYTTAGFGLASENVTALPPDVDSVQLSTTIRHHLNLTKHNVKIPKDDLKSYKGYLKSLGFTTRKEEYKNAKCVMIIQVGETTTLFSTKNGGVSGTARGFQGNPQENIVISSDLPHEDFGLAVKEAWNKCN